MSTPEELKAYQRGYRAGKNSAKAKRVMGAKLAQQQAFEDRAFLALLPMVFASEFNWGVEVDGAHQPYKSPGERIAFALDMARQATVQRGNK